MRIVEQTKQKIKHLETVSWIDNAMWVAIVFFIALGSFSLGILHEREYFRNQNPITVEYNQAAVDLWNQYELAQNANTEFYASKNGSIVYPIDCSRGERIKEENRIYFTDIEQALELGYREVDGC